MTANFSFHDLRPEQGSFLTDVLDGLSAARKSIPPKYFYDPRGARLFEAICGLPEYYPTRTETAMLMRDAAELAAAIGTGSVVIEYGSGSGRKTRLLLDAVAPHAYVAIDISGEQLQREASDIARSYSGIEVLAVCADYARPLDLPLPPALASRRRVVFFPGSTIGNFTPEEAEVFLAGARRVAGAGGGLLIGVDLQKDKATLDAAYDDAQGVTAEFNLNLLDRINRELGGDFDRTAFRHLAFYDPAAGRIEMHLESLRAQEVSVAGRRFAFRAGETIHTENSYKYTVESFQALAARAGFAPRRCWLDERRLFSVHYMDA